MQASVHLRILARKTTHRLFLTVARLYLTGSSMNELGCRSSDADLCLVIKGNVSKAASHATILYI